MSNWMSHVEWVIMFITLIGGFYSMDSRIDAVNSRIDGLITTVDTRIDAVNARFDQFIMAWHEESKDFHGKLCAIEERNKK